jgi:predicted dehydrogenase
MAGSYVDAKSMLDAARRTGRMLSVQLSTLFAKETKLAKHLIEKAMQCPLVGMPTDQHTQRRTAVLMPGDAHTRVLTSPRDYGPVQPLYYHIW